MHAPMYDCIFIHMHLLTCIHSKPQGEGIPVIFYADVENVS